MLGILLSGTLSLYAQPFASELSLEGAIALAKEHSAQARMARYSFMGQYWNYRSYRAQLLPSLNLSGNLGNYDRSLVEVRNSETGTISYLENNTFSNDLRVSINQNVALTGGQLSINSYAARLEQYRYDKITYNTNPMTLNYTQPLFAFNALKWQRRTAPLQYENSRKKYLETMEQITIQTTSLFFAVLAAQSDYKKSKESHAERTRLYEIARKRMELGTINRSELLQLRLSILNTEMSVNTTKFALDMQLFNLCFYIGLKSYEGLKLEVPGDVPPVELDYETVLHKAYTNSTHTLTQDLKRLQSQRALAQAKAARGLQADFRVNLGFSQSAGRLDDAYKRLKDREVVGIAVKVPIYHWGLGKGKVKMAEAELDIVETEIDMAEREFRQNILNKVVQFNNQARQCEIAVIAREIATERYEITLKRFQNGTVTVTDLNTAQQEFDDAQTRYINQLRTFWISYYELRKISLYDYIRQEDITAQFDKLIQ